MPRSQRIFVFLAVLAVGQMAVRSTNGQNDKIRTAKVDSLAFSPDSKFLATAGYRMDIVHIWNVETAEPVGELKVHLGAVRGVAWSPDGNTLASAGEDMTVRLWDARSYREQAVLVGHESNVYSVAFSPDGKTLASGALDSSARLWSVRDKSLRATLRPNDRATDIAFSPDGKTLATGGGKTVRFWSVDSGKELGALPRQAPYVSSLAFSPDGRALATVSIDRTLKVWELPNQRELFAIDTGVPHYCVAYSRDGKLIAVQGADNVVQLRSATTGKVISTLHGHTSHLRALAFSPDGATLASGGLDRRLILWDVAAHLKNPIGDKAPQTDQGRRRPLDGIIP